MQMRHNVKLLNGNRRTISTIKTSRSNIFACVPVWNDTGLDTLFNTLSLSISLYLSRARAHTRTLTLPNHMAANLVHINPFLYAHARHPHTYNSFADKSVEYDNALSRAMQKIANKLIIGWS